jgi:hypothetical protein
VARSTGREARRTRRARQRRVSKIGTRAEIRGRAVPPTVAGYRDAAKTGGHDLLANALIARHHLRLERLEQVAPLTQASALPSLTGIFNFDVAIHRLDPQLRMPVSMGTTWIGHLSWGLDSIAAATRLVMCLQMVGAALVTRTQLERWSTNLGDNIGQEQRPGEDTATWMNRIWNVAGSQRIHFARHKNPPAELHTAVLERQILAGHCFAELSELLHGRGPLAEVVWWETAEFDMALTSDHIRHLDPLFDAMTLCTNRIQFGLASAAASSGHQALAQGIFLTPILGPSGSELRPLLPYLRPIEMPLVRDDRTCADFVMAGTTYQKGVQQFANGGVPNFPPEWAPALSFAERRARAFVLARSALLAEQQQFGEEVNDTSMMRFSVKAIFAAEMSAMLARWLRERGDHAAATSFLMCSSALRSAVWLWLEDDERAMGCLRVHIEHLARLRTLRTKPAAAANLDSRAETTTPRDWIEACGWRRLRVLLRALGEFAHGADSAHLEGAADLLIALNPLADRAIAEVSGRTNVLSDLIVMLSGECAEWLPTFDADLASSYWRLIRLNQNQIDSGIEKRLQRAWANRSHPVRGNVPGGISGI